MNFCYEVSHMMEKVVKTNLEANLGEYLEERNIDIPVEDLMAIILGTTAEQYKQARAVHETEGEEEEKEVKKPKGKKGKKKGTDVEKMDTYLSTANSSTISPKEAPKEAPKETSKETSEGNEKEIVEETNEGQTEIKTCQYELTRSTKNKKKGEICGEKVVAGEVFCRPHIKTGKKNAGKKGGTDKKSNAITPAVVEGMYVPANEKETQKEQIVSKITEKDLPVGLDEYKDYLFEKTNGFLLKNLPNGKYLAEYIKTEADTVPRALSEDEKTLARESGFMVVKTIVSPKKIDKKIEKEMIDGEKVEKDETVHETVKNEAVKDVPNASNASNEQIQVQQTQTEAQNQPTLAEQQMQAQLQAQMQFQNQIRSMLQTQNPAFLNLSEQEQNQQVMMYFQAMQAQMQQNK